MTNKECEFARDGLCEVSTLLVGLPVLSDDKACKACIANSNPMSINPVTCSRAASAARKAGLQIPAETLNCIREGQQQGPGTELKKILSRFVAVASDCGCNAHAHTMNIWGPDVCEQNMPQIVGWLRDESHKRWPATKYLPIDWTIEKLVRRAIHRARRKSVRDQSTHQTGSATGLLRPVARG